MRINIERRHRQRFARTFANIEERDAFLATHFPNLMHDKKPGYFVTPDGRKVAVWNSRVMWSTPQPRP